MASSYSAFILESNACSYLIETAQFLQLCHFLISSNLKTEIVLYDQCCLNTEFSTTYRTDTIFLAKIEIIPRLIKILLTFDCSKTTNMTVYTIQFRKSVAILVFYKGYAQRCRLQLNALPSEAKILERFVKFLQALRSYMHNYIQCN